jgi:hypothetical protein
MFHALTIAMALTGGVDAAPTTSPDISGTWGIELSLVSASKIPVLGDMDSTTITYGRLHSQRGEDGWTQRYEVCDVDLVDRGSVVTSSIPEAFVDALPERTVRPHSSASAHGWRFQMDLGATHMGYDPAISARPPTSPSDPAITDPDGDGAPGATVVVSVPLFSDVEIHITQGTTLAIDGAWMGPDTIRGQAHVSYLEQNVVGASNRLFARSPSIQPVNELSTFTMVRLPDDASCDELPALVRAADASAPRAVASATR